MATHSSILAWRIHGIHGQRSLAGYSSWGHKESDVTEQLTLNTGLADNPPLERNDSAQKRAKLKGDSQHTYKNKLLIAVSSLSVEM